MPNTIFVSGSANANLIPQKWDSRQIFKWAFASNPLAKFMGTGDGAIIQVNKDFIKEKGEKMTFWLRGLLNTEGQGNDGTYEGYEEDMAFSDADLTIGERGHSTKLNGNMTEQRSVMNLRQQAGVALAEWVARAQARDIIDALSGMPNMKFGGHLTGISAATYASTTALAGVNVAPTTVVKVAVDKAAVVVRWMGGGQSASGMVYTSAASNSAMTSTMLFGPSVIENVRAVAVQEAVVQGTAAGVGTAQVVSHISPLRPINIDGEEVFLFLIDPFQAMALRKSPDWIEAQKHAQLSGRSNPIFTTAFGKWNDVIVHVSPLLHRRRSTAAASTDRGCETFFETSGDQVATSLVSANGYGISRALFLGAQAALMGWAKLPSYVEDPKDYKTKFAVHTDMLYGVKKAAFDARASTGTTGTVTPFGCIVVDTCSIKPA
jgi:N4-gp56 family major capsid protein